MRARSAASGRGPRRLQERHTCWVHVEAPEVTRPCARLRRAPGRVFWQRRVHLRRRLRAVAPPANRHAGAHHDGGDDSGDERLGDDDGRQGRGAAAEAARLARRACAKHARRRAPAARQRAVRWGALAADRWRLRQRGEPRLKGSKTCCRCMPLRSPGLHMQRRRTSARRGATAIATALVAVRVCRAAVDRRRTQDATQVQSASTASQSPSTWARLSPASDRERPGAAFTHRASAHFFPAGVSEGARRVSLSKVRGRITETQAKLD